MLYSIGRSLFRTLFTVAYGWRVDGVENVPDRGPVILAANHMSYLDPPLVGAALHRPAYFMAKAELFKVPLFGAIIRRVNAFPVQRGSADRNAIRHSLQLLEAGHALALFPEGTRSRTGELLAPQSGVSLIALRSEAPVIPIGITGTSRVDRSRHPRKRPRVGIRFGPPVELSDLRGMRGSRVMDEASARVMEAIRLQLQFSRDGRIRRADLE